MAFSFLITSIGVVFHFENARSHWIKRLYNLNPNKQTHNNILLKSVNYCYNGTRNRVRRATELY